VCGISGIAYADGRGVERPVLEEMTSTLRHRGPDDEGICIIRTSNSNLCTSKVQVGLGHRRLSIIDLSEAGHQPMANEKETIWITYNGEIYNYPDLRKDLINKGHVFSSNTDTEVIIHGYEQYGEDIFKRLNGMFSFGLWDDSIKSLYLVRDRYGQKPLYYYHSGKHILFASELKSLLKHPLIKREIDINNLSRYLAFEYVPAPYSIIKGVNKLLPGHFLKWKDGESRTTPFWKICFNPNDRNGFHHTGELESCLIDLLKKSIKRRLMSDVPLGVFLSGGIDSSAIVALMSELLPPDNIKTFSIGFTEESFDESTYARGIADLFGTKHYEQILTPGKMLEILPEVWDFMDEPFADASIIPTYLLSKFTREHVTVALGGDGGDELFAGYDPFIAHAAARYYEKVPGYVHDHVIVPIVNRLPVSTANISLDFKMKQFLKGIPYERAIRNQVWLGSFTKEEQRKIFSYDFSHNLNGFDPYGDIYNSLQKTNLRDQIDEIIYLYSRFYLADDILVKVDRASMANSLEVRSPFLDVDFAEFSNSLPSFFKIRKLCRKYILKKAIEYKLPRNILKRKKKGFGVPLAKWFKGELKPIIMETFSPNKIREDGIFDIKSVQNLLDDHLKGKKDNRKQIWTLFMFQMWKERYA